MMQTTTRIPVRRRMISQQLLEFIKIPERALVNSSSVCTVIHKILANAMAMNQA